MLNQNNNIPNYNIDNLCILKLIFSKSFIGL